MQLQRKEKWMKEEKQIKEGKNMNYKQILSVLEYNTDSKNKHKYHGLFMIISRKEIQK